MGRDAHLSPSSTRVARDFGAWLQSSAGCKKGDRVAIMMPNVLQYPIAHVRRAARRAASSSTPIRSTPRASSSTSSSDSGATAIVVLENFAHVAAGSDRAHAACKHVIVTGVGDMLGFAEVAASSISWCATSASRCRRGSMPGAMRFQQALHGRARGMTLAAGDARVTTDIAFLQYTGGTTGVAKGAMLTHGNMVANVLQARAWIRPAFHDASRARSITRAAAVSHLRADRRTACCSCMLGWQQRADHQSARLPGVRRGAARSTASRSSRGVNTLFNALLHTPGFDKLDFSALRVTLGGGMAVQAAVAERWKEVTGKMLTQAWGLTETSPAACINPLDATSSTARSACRFRRPRSRIRDDDGNELGIGEVGEICVRGPQVMAGYWNRPDETAKVMIAGRLAAHRRHRPHGRARLRLHRGSQEGHDPGVGLQRVSERGRERRRARIPACSKPPRSRSPTSSSGEVVALFVVRKDPNLTEQRADRALPQATHRLQGAEARRISGRSCRRRTSARFCGGSCGTA